MATSKTSQATTLQIKVKTGTKDDGEAIQATRTLSRINPALTDDDAFQVASGLAGFQAYELSSIHRVDSAVLENE